MQALCVIHHCKRWIAPEKDWMLKIWQINAKHEKRGIFIFLCKAILQNKCAPRDSNPEPID